MADRAVDKHQVLPIEIDGSMLDQSPAVRRLINQGDRRIKQKKDGWTVVTRDKKLSAQWEHTVAVTADGVEILTLRDEERRAGYAERY